MSRRAKILRRAERMVLGLVMIAAARMLEWRLARAVERKSRIT